MAVPISRFVEEISILLLAIWGIAGEPFLNATFSAAGMSPAAACCPETGRYALSPQSRGLIVRVVGIPFGFAVSAELGAERPFILTLYSEPDRGPARPQRRLE